MIVGIGIDSVEVERFARWVEWPRKKLLRIFSDYEITYCLQNKLLSAQRFAARFAAREAFYKALTQYNPNHQIPFLTLCKLIEVRSSTTQQPLLAFTTHSILGYKVDRVTIHLSITHTEKTATVIIILQ